MVPSQLLCACLLHVTDNMGKYFEKYVFPAWFIHLNTANCKSKFLFLKKKLCTQIHSFLIFIDLYATISVIYITKAPIIVSNQQLCAYLFHVTDKIWKYFEQFVLSLWYIPLNISNCKSKFLFLKKNCLNYFENSQMFIFCRFVCNNMCYIYN